MSTATNFTLDDSAPFINYLPCADCNLTAGWAPWNAASGGFRDPSVPGEYAQGQSLHYTYTPEASFDFSFYGTGLYLFGSANCTYDVSMDGGVGGSSLSSTSNVLFSRNDLPQGAHFLNVTVHASSDQAFALDSAVVTSSLSSSDQLLPVTYDNSNSTLQYSGAWQSLYDAQIPNKASPKNYTQTSQSGASVALNFTGAAVAINSPVNWGHWIYNVTLDGVSQQYNASTYWLVGDTVLFYQSGLDPTTQHQIKLINTGGAGMVMNLNDITVYAPANTATPSSSSSSAGASTQPSPTASSPQDSGTAHHDVNVGVIVGPVVAVVIALLALVVGIFFWRRHKRAAPVGGDTHDNLSPAPWYGAYNHSHTSDREKAGIDSVTLSMPNQGFHPNGSSAVVSEPFNPYTNATNQQSTAQLSSVHASQVRPLPSPPTGASDAQQRPSPPPTAQQPGIDVNAIIELIAQRIDRPPAHPSVAPPQYPS